MRSGVVTGTSRVTSVCWGYTEGTTFPVENVFLGWEWGAFIGSSPTCIVTVCMLMKSVNENYSKKLIFHSQHFIPPAPYKKIVESAVEFIV
jgi:hypothetical protein